MRKLSCSFILLLITLSSFAQDFSNKGKDFWLGYGYHVRFVTTGTSGALNGQEMVLYFATENIPNTTTDIKIEIPALGYVENISNVPPGTIITSATIPKSGAQDARLTDEGTFESGIHVTTTRPVVAYAHIYDGNVSGATLLFPTNTLGKDYYSINYKQVSNETNSNSFFFVVAADTGVTTVEITPSVATLTHAANVPFTINLNQGQIYNVMGQLTGGSTGNFTGGDLTGSRIRSISGSGGRACKKIAVFSGAGKMKIACSGNGNSSDNLIAQAFPKSAWGKRFLTAPTKNMPYNYFRVAVSDPAAVVKLNGVVQTALVNSFYYDLPLSNQPQLIESDQPVMVAQYITTANTCGNTALGGTGDPDMIYLSPVEQTIDEVILNSTGNYAITQHWINVIIKTASVGSFRIDGAAIPGSFFIHPQDPAFSYAQISVAQGSHSLSADSGFNAIAYGYGNAESYAYNAGTNLKDLYNFIIPLNPLNISGTNSACACTPFFYTITYPYQPISLYWDFKGLQTPNVSITNPVADSTYFINGKQVWQYRLPTPYTYCPAGNYPLSITAGTTGTDGCGNTQTKDDTLFVRNTPVTNFNWTHNGCVTDSVRFNDISTYDQGTYSYRWSWDFGDGNTSTDHNPAHKYVAAGTYTVKFSLISNIGCISQVTSKQVVVTNVPVANFGISSPLCEGRAITFTDSSKVFAPGTISKWYWNYGDGTLDSATTNANQVHAYTAWGSKNASLYIKTNSGCTSPFFIKSFVVNPNPVAKFIMPSGICLPYTDAAFTDATTIADGSQAGFSWKWKFGEPASGPRDSSIVQNPNHLYSGVGPFSIKLQVTSAAGCVDDTVQVLSNVYPKPTSSFTVNAENCLNTATAFTSTSNAQGGNTVTNWYWDFGDASAQGTGQSVAHTYTAAATYTIKHWIKTDKGCISDTITHQVTVNPLPSPDFSSSTPSCKSKAITLTDLSVANAGNIVKWTWNFGNGRPDSIINAATPFTYIYDSAKTYSIKLTVETNKGCKNALPFTKTIIVNPQPLAGFISPEVCLSDASAIFIDTSKVAGGTITNWNWNFGDPSSGITNTVNGTNATPQHKYNNQGLYTTTLIVTSNQGCVDTLRQSFTVNGAIPLARFRTLNQLNLCANDSVAIKDSSTVDFGNVTKVEIYWDNANAPTVFQLDDLPFQGKIYKHLYADFQTPLTKTFSVRYRAYSGGTCVNDFVLPVVVHAAPKVQFTAIPNVCLEATYQITEATETGGVPGPPGATFSGAGVSVAGLFTPSLVGPGTYRIGYKYVSAFGCTDTISQTIKVYAPAVANFGFSSPVCETKAATFTDSSTIPAASGTITTRKWNFGDGTPDSIRNNALPINHTYASAGSFTATLTLVTSNGCTVSKTKQVVINPLPAVSFRPSDSICLPNALVTFINSTSIADGTGNSLTYAWNFGDPTSGTSNTSTLKNPTHLFGTTGPYNVRLAVRSGTGCIKDTTIALTTIHPKPTANFSSDSVSLCQNQTVRFSDNSNGAGATVNNWQWDFGNGQTASIKNPAAITYTSTGTFTVKLNIENSFGCKADTSKPFRVYAYPVVDLPDSTVLLEGGQIVMPGTATGNSLLYAWSPATFLSSSTVLNPLVSGMTVDNTYKLTVTAAGGCQASDVIFVKILKDPIIPNTFTPNGDNFNPNWTITYLNSYPNCRVQVFNRYGQIVYETRNYPARGWDGTYNGKSLPFGTYYYIIEPGSGRKPITGYVTLIK